MTKTSSGTLEEQIGKLVREHLRAVRSSATAAVERAFAAAESESARRPRSRRSGKAGGRIGHRRAHGELSMLSERLYAAIVANPGATMTVLAARVGVSARELHWSTTLLRRAGRVRSAGQRHLTRYFPTASKAA